MWNQLACFASGSIPGALGIVANLDEPLPTAELEPLHAAAVAEHKRIGGSDKPVILTKEAAASVPWQHL